MRPSTRLLTLTRGGQRALLQGRGRDSALENFDRAFELGRRFDARDIQVLALSGKGRGLIKRGEIDEGLALLDEATAAAVCGELSPHSTGFVYCITISACHDLGDFRRAAEWTEAANSWCDSLDVRRLPGRVPPPPGRDHAPPR